MSVKFSLSAVGILDSLIKREKQIKAGSRKKEEGLVNTINKEWNDLYESI